MSHSATVLCEEQLSTRAFKVRTNLLTSAWHVDTTCIPHATVMRVSLPITATTWPPLGQPHTWTHGVAVMVCAIQGEALRIDEEVQGPHMDPGGHLLAHTNSMKLVEPKEV